MEVLHLSKVSLTAMPFDDGAATCCILLAMILVFNFLLFFFRWVFKQLFEKGMVYRGFRVCNLFISIRVTSKVWRSQTKEQNKHLINIRVGSDNVKFSNTKLNHHILDSETV